MLVQSIIPHPSIAHYISSIVVVQSIEQYDNLTIPLITNGLPSIVYQHNDSGLLFTNNSRADSLVLYGQNPKPIELIATGQLTVIAYFLHPHLLKAVSGFGANELTDLHVDLSLLQPAKSINLKEQLINAATLNDRLQLMNGFVKLLATRNVTGTNEAVHFATQSIQKNKGVISLRSLQAELNMSERTFQRLFDFHVGVSPKMYSRMCQFNKAFQQINQRQFSKIGDVAYQHGYADQSHMIRAFKEFTNFSPTDYLKLSEPFVSG